MMSKIQKIWLWIFGTMFVIPEVLWGNLLNIFKINFLPIYKNVRLFINEPKVAFLIIILEIIGISGLIYLVNKKSIELNHLLKYIFDVFLIIILLALLLSLFLSYSVSQIHFL